MVAQRRRGKTIPCRIRRDWLLKATYRYTITGLSRFRTRRSVSFPPGLGTLDLVEELTGRRARQSFLVSLDRASQSVYIVSEGTKLTYHVAKNIHEGSSAGADKISTFTRENSTLLVYRSSDLGKSIIGKSWELSKTVYQSKEKIGNTVVQGSQNVGEMIGESGMQQGTALAAGSLSVAKDISSSGTARSASAFTFAGNTFVKGYVAVPSKINKRFHEMGESLSETNFSGIIKEENESRRQWSNKAVDLMSDTVRRYPSNVTSSFSKAANELDGSYSTTGLSFAILKSLRWVLQGILWDATIEPATKITAASVGYIGVNSLAFPSMVVEREGVVTTALAVEVAWDTTKMGYDLVAPSTVASVAATYGLLDYNVSHAVAGAALGVGNVAGYGEAGMSQVASVVVKAGGYAAGRGVQYIGVTLASAGIAVGGGTIGTAVGGVGTVSGGALLVAGEAGSATTQAVGMHCGHRSRRWDCSLYCRRRVVRRLRTFQSRCCSRWLQTPRRYGANATTAVPIVPPPTAIPALARVTPIY